MREQGSVEPGAALGMAEIIGQTRGIASAA